MNMYYCDILTTYAVYVTCLIYVGLLNCLLSRSACSSEAEKEVTVRHVNVIPIILGLSSEKGEVL